LQAARLAHRLTSAAKAETLYTINGTAKADALPQNNNQLQGLSMSPQSFTPASPDAERALLGLILLEPRHLREVERSLDPEDFLLDSHRRIFRAMSAVVRSGREFDTITLIEALQSQGGPESVGGVAYIASLTDGVPRRASGSSYIRQIREKAGLRRLLRGLDGLQRTASAPGATLEACHGAASLLVSQLQGAPPLQFATSSAAETGAVRNPFQEPPCDMTEAESASHQR
jgi:hypothetical protein